MIPEEKRCPACRAGRVIIEQGRATMECYRCYGTGIRGARRPVPCPSCSGKGYNQGACVDCQGTGKKIS